MEVMPTGKRFWRLRYSEGGARRKLTLGQYPAVSLGEARAKRDELREAKARGIAPHEVLNPARKLTFSDVALEWFGKHVEPVRTAGHAQMARGALAPKRPQHFSALTRPEDILLPAVDRERSPQGTENSRARIRRVPNRARDLDSPPVRVAHSGREGIYTNSLLTKM